MRPLSIRTLIWQPIFLLWSFRPLTFHVLPFTNDESEAGRLRENYVDMLERRGSAHVVEEKNMLVVV